MIANAHPANDSVVVAAADAFHPLIPAEAGIQARCESGCRVLDSRLRGNERKIGAKKIFGETYAFTCIRARVSIASTGTRACLACHFGPGPRM